MEEHALTEEDAMDRFARVVVDETPVFLRDIFRRLWERRYGAPWMDGRDAGDQLLFGEKSFRVVLGQGKVWQNSNKIHVPGLQLKHVRLADLKEGDAPPEGLWEGSCLCVPGEAEDDVLWIEQIKHSGPHTKITLEDKFKRGDEGPKEHTVEIRGRSRALYDRHVPGSAVQGKAARDKILAGRPDDWDTALICWVLLDSGHDGQGGGKPEGLAHGVGAIKAGLRRIRNVRNQYGHPGAWKMGRDVLLEHLRTICDGLLEADQAFRDDPGWTPLVPRFHAIVRKVINERGVEKDRLRFVLALRQRPFHIPFARNDCFTGRDDYLEDLREMYFGGAAADGGGGGATVHATLVLARRKEGEAKHVGET
eukprot:g6515.t1